MVIENGVFELGRKCIGKGLNRRFDIEGDKRREQSLGLGAGQSRNTIAEIEREPGANWVLSVALDDRVGVVRVCPDGDVAQEGMLGVRSAVEHQYDL